MHEPNTKEKIDEFKKESLVDLVDKLKNGVHGAKGQISKFRSTLTSLVNKRLLLQT